MHCALYIQIDQNLNEDNHEKLLKPKPAKRVSELDKITVQPRWHQREKILRLYLFLYFSA